MAFRRRAARGSVFLLTLLLVLGLASALFAFALVPRTALRSDAASERALAQAREALIAYAVGRPITSTVGPGYLPCPDLDNDGWAESTCGSLDGSSGQAARLGRLPWKTLGLPDLRDGAGERLWYAVSTKYKGLLNCGASASCLDMTPPHASGTITLRAPSGVLIHDGRDASGAVAIVIAPGAPLERLGGSIAAMQSRTCAPGDCDGLGACLATPPQAAGTCDPRNYLDRAPDGATQGEDNADFIDRSDAAGRASNANGFIAGPVRDAEGKLRVNDRIVAIAFEDLMPRILHRVALEVAHCLRFYAGRAENGQRFPLPVAACARGARFGWLPDAPFTTAIAPAMLPRWWRTTTTTPENLADLPAHDDACRIAVAPDDPGPVRTWPPAAPASEGTTATAPSWWRAWQPFVFVSIANGHEPSAAPPADCTRTSSCITLVDESSHAVATQRQAAVIVAASCPGDDVCADASCDVITTRTGVRDLHAVVAIP